MSRQALESVTGRAILDAEFRMALFADPDATLGGYALTEAELKSLKSVDAESLDVCGGSVGRQILRNLAGEYHSTGVDPPLTRCVSLRQGPESISFSPDPTNGLGSAGALCLP